MKLLIAVTLLVAAVAVRAQSPESDASTLVLNEQVGVDGFAYNYETSNGITQSEEGKLKNAGTDSEGIEVHGSYTYTDPSGKKVIVEYTADENGYHPKTIIE